MNSCKLPLTELCETAVRAALKAGELIASYQGRRVEVLSKDGGDNLASSVVTEVDFRSQEIILETLKECRERFDLGLLTEEEEDDGSRFEKEAFWCIDPIDGTLPFTEGVAGYAVSIGLISREGESLLGVVYDPLTGTLYSAVAGEGAFRNGESWKLSPPAGSDDAALTWILDRDQVPLPCYKDILRVMEREAQRMGLKGLTLVNNGGAVLNACWAMENPPALYFKIPKKQKGGGCFWDFAATACIVKEAGGLVSDFSSGTLNLNHPNFYMNGPGVLFLTSPDLEKLAEQIRGLESLRRGMTEI